MSLCMCLCVYLCVCMCFITIVLYFVFIWISLCLCALLVSIEAKKKDASFPGIEVMGNWNHHAECKNWTWVLEELLPAELPLQLLWNTFLPVLDFFLVSWPLYACLPKCHIYYSVARICMQQRICHVYLNLFYFIYFSIPSICLQSA